MVASAAGTSIKVAVNEATGRKPRRSTRRCAAQPKKLLNVFATVFLSLSLYALITRKYKLLLTNCIRHLNVCLDALSRLISVRLAQIKYTQRVYVCEREMS